MTGEREPLFCYCLAVGGREFAIRVGRNGTIHWDDYQQRRSSRPGEGAVLMTEPDEFTVSFELEPELLARFRQAAALLETMKDLLNQTYVRKAKLRQALKVRRFFADQAAGIDDTEAEPDPKVSKLRP